MVTIPLTEGSYNARSVIAAAQRCVNLYPEINQRQALTGLPQGVTPALVTHYPTPGLRPLAQGPLAEVRGLFRANNDLLYAVIGPQVFLVNQNWTMQLLGIIASSAGQVSMCDNGRTLMIVDNTDTGYVVDLATSIFGTVTDQAYLGATKVDYLASFLVFNQPNSQNFYTSQSNQVPASSLGTYPALSNSYAAQSLYALSIAQKAGYGDNIVTLVSLDRQLWVFGRLTTEVWYVSGGTIFPFAVTQNALFEHGCAAQYSAAKLDDSIIWLSINLAGKIVVVQGQGYNVNRISTNAIENEIQSYAVYDDAIAMTYQQLGHSFYVLTFPNAGKTWVYDNSTQEWHERMWLDGGGNERRHRANCMAFAYGVNVCGDFENGKLYALDINQYTDDSQPIKRIRGFPHEIQETKRLVFDKFVADIQCGTNPDNASDLEGITVALRWSDTRGASWLEPIYQSLGSTGQFYTNVQWRRLGISRDRVFELSWTLNALTGLNGAFVDVRPSIT